jgi:hypothetical protein
VKKPVLNRTGNKGAWNASYKLLLLTKKLDLKLGLEDKIGKMGSRNEKILEASSGNKSQASTQNTARRKASNAAQSI